MANLATVVSISNHASRYWVRRAGGGGARGWWRRQLCTCRRLPVCSFSAPGAEGPPLPPQPAGTAPNHALLLVGYSTQTAGQEHFLAKNSLGAGWGEAGFVRLAMAGDGAGLCGMYRAACQPAADVAVGPGKPANGNM